MDIWYLWDLGHHSLVENGLKGWYWFWSNNLQKKLLFFTRNNEIFKSFVDICCWRRNYQIPLKFATSHLFDAPPANGQSTSSVFADTGAHDEKVGKSQVEVQIQCRSTSPTLVVHEHYKPCGRLRQKLSVPAVKNGMFLAWQQLRKLQCPESEYKTWNSPQHLHPQSSSAPSGIYKLLLDTTTLFLYKARRPLSKQAPSWCQETAPNFQTGRATPKCMKWGHALHFL